MKSKRSWPPRQRDAPRNQKKGTMIDRHELGHLYCWLALDASSRRASSDSVSSAGANFGSAAGISEINKISRELMSSVKATQLRPGMVIQHEGQLFTVFSTEHRTPGNK